MAQMACPQCGAVFDNRDDLREHRNVCGGEFVSPEGEFKHKCSRCGQRFNTEEALGAHHIRAHAGEQEP
ncbi:C2H2-type zinc finger protein [Methylobacter sp. sgz302048]|uniref:C2H2-type zinc finger protein n=1 Tax=Methylobacter sp. sgz302048 TaxID=3455945 RepID=UPI003FA12D76